MDGSIATYIGVKVHFVLALFTKILLSTIENFIIYVLPHQSHAAAQQNLTTNDDMCLVGVFSVIVQPVVEPMDHYTALYKIEFSAMQGVGTQFNSVSVR